MAETPHIDRKGIKKDDLFVSRGKSLLESLLRHRTQFLPVAILIGVSLAGVAGYQWWESRQLEKNWTRVHEAMSLEEAKRWDAVAQLYGELSNGRPRFFMAVTAADHYFAESKKELAKDDKTVPPSSAKALEWYDKALSFGGLLTAEKQLLLINKGNVLEIQKKYDEAMTQYQAAIDTVNTYKALALLSLARVMELKGERPKAIETYEKISTDFASNEFGKLARNHLRRLKSPFLSEVKS